MLIRPLIGPNTPNRGTLFLSILVAVSCNSWLVVYQGTFRKKFLKAKGLNYILVVHSMFHSQRIILIVKYGRTNRQAELREEVWGH